MAEFLFISGIFNRKGAPDSYQIAIGRRKETLRYTSQKYLGEPLRLCAFAVNQHEKVIR